MKNISYILRFIDTARVMAKSLSNHVSNLFEVIHRIKCQFGYDDKKCKTCGIRCKYSDCFLEYTNFKYYLIKYKCLLCKNDFLIHASFLTTTIISLFHCYEKVLNFMNIWVLGKNFMKCHYLRIKIFTIT